METIKHRLEEILAEIHFTRYSPINGDETEPSGITGYETGFAEIDKLTCGFQRGELILFSAYPYMGKTTFLLSMINNNIDKYTSIIYFSTRLSTDQLIKRLICNLSRTELHDLQGGFTGKDFFGSFDNTYKKCEIYFDDFSDLDYETMCKLVEESELLSQSIIIVDDINNMNISVSNNRTETIFEKLAILKKIAKKYRVPVIAVYQLEIPKVYSNKIPEHKINHIENSLVDMYFSLYRPEYFRITEDEEGNSLIGKAEVLLCGTGTLCNNGYMGKPVNLNYCSKYFLFTDKE